MKQTTSPTRAEIPSTAARRDYDDGNPGTIVTGNMADVSIDRRAGDWAQSVAGIGDAGTYYDDGEAATIPV
ncbi:MAG: hypothetical protein HOL07_12240 [Rhodospirillaceae bacterium]|jgi:hypothetical protein|nr:hypothetical protein [Rhodospirillaceae bacterium]MBT3808626.1 hypothetical protein [Rhodospirillaceae bacterium]MBT3930525.1 hypothetical protein [Rhodospirillaceae bacterium]MBT4771383.1 hypothetical protein [Rhodospirillaceae bacterium]MBT5359107.1 hypothetical protein [Rhodospirillaceae bacterium]